MRESKNNNNNYFQKQQVTAVFAAPSLNLRITINYATLKKVKLMVELLELYQLN